MQDPHVYQGPGADSHPQTCVDWCDAYMYCKAVGKRLCGRIGGGALGFTEWGDAAKSQWFAACSSGGAEKYPYGDTYESKTCNGGDSGGTTTTQVGALDGCQSHQAGYEGVFDMSGNAWEWDDSCQDDKPDAYCQIRGGGVAGAGPDHMACNDTPLAQQRNQTGYPLGFRCCSP